jgi:hypothetical protein
MYEQSGAEAPGADGAEPQPDTGEGSDETVDAEFREVGGQ